VRLHPVISWFAATLIAFAPFNASAQETQQSASVRDRPRPEYDPLGLRFGGFDLNARLDVGVAHVDNIFGTETNAQGDQVYTIAPQAQLTSHWSRNALDIEAGYQHTAYDKFSSQDTNTGFVSTHGLLQLGANTEVNASAGYARQVEPRTDPDALQAGKPVLYDVAQGGASISQSFNYLRLTASGLRIDSKYHDVGAIDQKFRDNVDDSGTLRAEYAITPRIGIVGQASLDHRRYNNDPNATSNGRTYLVGAHIQFTDLMQGEVTVGEFQRRYHGGERLNGVAVNANLEWYITPLTTLAFTANRGAQEQGATTDFPYVESQYGARADHELLRNLILSAGAGFGERKYRVIDRKDDFDYGEVDANYLLNRRVALTLDYRHDNINSTGLNRYRNSDVNTVSLGVSLRL